MVADRYYYNNAGIQTEKQAVDTVSSPATNNAGSLVALSSTGLISQTLLPTASSATIVVTNFTDLPAANSVTSYTQRYFVTNVGVGGSEWYSDGTRWRVVGGQVVLKALSSSDTQPTFNWTGTALTIDNTLFTIPAGLLNTGNIIDVEIDYTCTSGTITTPQIYTRSGGQTVGQGGSYTLSAGDFAVTTAARVSLFSSYRLDNLTTVTPLRCGNGGTFGATYSGSIRRGATIPSVSNTALDITSRIVGGATTATIVVDGLIVTLKTCG